MAAFVFLLSPLFLDEIISTHVADKKAAISLVQTDHVTEAIHRIVRRGVSHCYAHASQGKKHPFP